MRRMFYKRRPILLAVVAVCFVGFVLLTKGSSRFVNIIAPQKGQESTIPESVLTTTSSTGHSGPFSSPLEDLSRYPCFPGSKKGSALNGCVRIFDVTEELNKDECHLISYRTLGGNTPMCTYDRDVDNYISGSLQRTGAWEGKYVQSLAQILKDHPDMMFLDLGCNIGTFTLAAAKLGRKVVAVDPMLENLRLLSYSLSLGKIRDRVTLVWNAVSDSYEDVTLKKYRGNVGGTAIEHYDGKDMKNSTYLVKTILLDDLVPLIDGKPVVMKMDIETKELSALLGGMHFLDEVDVRVIQMEFGPHRKDNSGKQIVEILSSRGLIAYRDSKGTGPLNVNEYSHWPDDVYFIKDA